MRRSLSLLLILAAGAPAIVRAAPPKVLLADSGKAVLPVVVSSSSSPEVRRAAETLAAMLGRISGARFAVEVSEKTPKRALVLGTTQDFPCFTGALVSKTATRAVSREDYLLRSESSGSLLLIGATPLAVERAVWDLLHRLGYRQFFPGPTWEVVPKQPRLEIAVDGVERPDFLGRLIWYGHGLWDYNEAAYKDWASKNRMGGLVISSGHAYDAILRRGAEAFAAHPEWLGLVDGTRKSSKFCISNPALREHVVGYAMSYFAERPDADSISMEPSDGAAWCECDACRKLGSPSDRAVTLANQVAVALREKYPGKRVGMYAYNRHAPPPSIRVEPNVVVSVATAFQPGGLTTDELLARWRAMGAEVGIREFLSINAWDRDAPGVSRASNLDYVRTSIPHFYAQGARYYSAESSDSWGPSGLGYYLASRYLWDVDEAQRADALRQDFLTRAFGPARAPMEAFYAAVDGAKNPLPSDDLVGRLYRLLEEARSLAVRDPAVLMRVDDFVLYARYTELLFTYRAAQDDARQAAFEALLRHTYRMRRTMLVHAKALTKTLPKRDRLVTIPQEALWNVPVGKNPWKSDAPFTSAEIAAFIAEGKSKNATAGFSPVQFSSKDILPLPLEEKRLTALINPKAPMPDVLRKKLELGASPSRPGPGEKVRAAKAQASAPRSPANAAEKKPPPITTRGDLALLAVVPEGEKVIRLTVTSGLVGPARNMSRAQIAVSSADDPSETTLATAEVPQDKAPHEVELAVPGPGPYLVEISDRMMGTTTDWPAGAHVGVRIDPDAPVRFLGRMSMYFFVPRGTTVIGGYSANVGHLVDGSGKKVHEFPSKPGYFKVPVPEAQQGTFWRFEKCAGTRLLLTVPPLLFRSPDEAVLPREVVERAS